VISPRLAKTLVAVVILVAITLSIALFVQADAASHSVSDTLYDWVPQASLVALAAAIVVLVVGRAARP
jgi:hypothetical protein